MTYQVAKRKAGAVLWAGMVVLAAGGMRAEQAPAAAEPVEKLVEALLRRGREWEVAGRFREAETCGKEAVRQAEEAHQPLLEAVALNWLGGLSSQTAAYAEGERAFRRALSITMAAFGPAHPNVAAVQSALGSMLLHLGRYPEAESLLTQAVRIQQRSQDHRNRLGNTLDGLSALRRLQGDYVAAETFGRRAISVLESVHGPKHLDVGSAHFNLARLYAEVGSFPSAEMHYRRAIEIFQQVQGNDHPSLAIGQAALGNLYCMQKQYDRAEPVLREALVRLEVSLGPKHPELAFLLFDLSEVAAYHKHPGEAATLLQRAAHLVEEAFGRDHPVLPSVWARWAVLQAEAGDVQEAGDRIERALTLARKSAGEEHLVTAYVLRQLAQVLRIQGRKKEAHAAERQAQAMQSRIVGANRLGGALSLGELQALGASGRTVAASRNAGR